MRRVAFVVALAIAIGSCAGPEEPATPTPEPTHPPQVVVVVPTQVPTPVNVAALVPTVAPTPPPPSATPRPPPTATPVPTATPRGRTYAAILPPDLVGRTDVRWLPVPYRSQFDGNPYEESDCGPASMGMILAAYGKEIPTLEIRRLVNKLQGTEGNVEAGTLIENLHVASEKYGLRPSGLFADKGFRRWTLAEVRQRLDAGVPVVPQVWYRGLPGRETREYNGDHYIVLTGYVGETFIYNDPVDKDGPGQDSRISATQLNRAWLNGDFPYAAVAIAGPPERPTLRRV